MANIQSEAMLEAEMIRILSGQGYEKIAIKDEEELNRNFKLQFERHNKEKLEGKKLSDLEFKQVMNYLNKGITIFERSKLLRDLVSVDLDNGKTVRLQLINMDEWCQNIYQVTNQITMEGKFKNRYDVTLLINGIPMVQIELKRRGMEIKEAFNQVVRYSRQSASYHGLFGYIQIFVISNGENTKYYSNNKTLDFKQTFYWTDKENNKMSSVEEFTIKFLEKCHISKMISRYIVLNETNKALMILRPYQYYAVEAILDRVENTNKNGYIWHTTGSGKTLTSFKASQVLARNKNISKVIFVVDRNDLDYQTLNEFNSFEKGSVDGTDDTKQLIKTLLNPEKKLLITTIQKLNAAISKKNNSTKLSSVKNKKIIFVFDECHRSQFGKTHKNIDEFFTNKQMIGFTGTPIFKKNAIKTRTTENLFNERLHRYIIQDAINDGNVLGFSVEYIGRLKENEGSKKNLDIEVKVEDIDKKEFLESEKRIEKIVDYIIENHDKKTYNLGSEEKNFTGIFAINNVKTLIKYYDIFKKKQEEGKHQLKIATIFTFAQNEDAEAGDGDTEIDIEDINFDNKGKIDESSREKLESYMEDYNKIFGGNFTTKVDKGFNSYYVDIATRVKNRDIDLLLVVNMFLTGFDSKFINTLYVDKNLKYHGLIQAFSRTNRIYGERKKYGNIVCFRNIKDRVDEAITLFSNKDAIGTVVMKSYEEYLEDYNKAVKKLREICENSSDVDSLQSDEEKKNFIEAFREVMRIRNKLQVFTDFEGDNIDLEMKAQEFENFTSKYKDLKREVEDRGNREKHSILEDVDFELELIWKDNINVGYILTLLKDLDHSNPSFERDKNHIVSIVEKSENLKNKRELIIKFIDEQMKNISKNQDIEGKFEEYMEEEREKEFNKLVEVENLNKEKVCELIEDYEFYGKIDKELTKETFMDKFKFSERRVKVEVLNKKIKNFLKKFEW